MAHPNSKHIITTVFAGLAALIGIFLLATVNGRYPLFVPWSSSHLRMPGFKGVAKFGLLHTDMCMGEQPDCHHRDYEWLSQYTKVWKSDAAQCTTASYAVIACLSVATATAIAATTIAIVQLTGRAKTSAASNFCGAMLLLSTFGFAASVGVWEVMCSEKLAETTSVSLSWGFALAVIGGAVVFLAFLMELVAAAPTAPELPLYSVGGSADAGLLESHIGASGVGALPPYSALPASVPGSYAAV